MGYFIGFKEEITGLSYAVMGWIPSSVMEHGWKFLPQNGISMGKSSINIYQSGISNCHIRSKYVGICILHMYKQIFEKIAADTCICLIAHVLGTSHTKNIPVPQRSTAPHGQQAAGHIFLPRSREVVPSKGIQNHRLCHSIGRPPHPWSSAGPSRLQTWFPAKLDVFWIEIHGFDVFEVWNMPPPKKAFHHVNPQTFQG